MSEVQEKTQNIRNHAYDFVLQCETTWQETGDVSIVRIVLRHLRARQLVVSDRSQVSRKRLRSESIVLQDRHSNNCKQTYSHVYKLALKHRRVENVLLTVISVQKNAI